MCYFPDVAVVFAHPYLSALHCVEFWKMSIKEKPLKNIFNADGISGLQSQSMKDYQLKKTNSYFENQM